MKPYYVDKRVKIYHGGCTDEELLKQAWEWREFAYAWNSGTKVGCAIFTKTSHIVGGFNIEGFWMTSIHAEVSAIIQLLSYPLVTYSPNIDKGVKVAIVSNTKHFTPCGACCDWLFQFCVPDAVVLIQNNEGKTTKYHLKDLMPHYPRQ